MALDNRGSVAVIVAFFLTVFITILGFVVNEGWLFANKNIFQNAAEAGAMAGAARLCEGDAVSVARQIAIENGAPQDGITVEVGFYDEADAYEDFPQYTNFIADPDPDTPENENLALGDDQYEYDNAVLVRIERDEPVILGGFLGRDQARVVGLAVGYLVRYGMLALGEGDEGGITFRGFNSNQPVIRNGDIHANANVIFENQNPDIDETVRVSASGEVQGYDEGISGAHPISIRPVSDEYLSKLRDRAYKIITIDDFPTQIGEEYKRTDEEGNEYLREGFGAPPTFRPHLGDHGGKIYFFEGDVVQLGNHSEGEDGEITGLTFVSTGDILWRAVGVTVKWGGRGNNQVIIIAGGDINFGGIFHSDGFFDAMGVVFRAGGNIYWRVTSSHGGHASDTRTLRMISDKKIDIQGPGWWYPANTGFNMKFGPPCPPYMVRLGRLVSP